MCVCVDGRNVGCRWGLWATQSILSLGWASGQCFVTRGRVYSLVCWQRLAGPQKLGHE